MHAAIPLGPHRALYLGARTDARIPDFDNRGIREVRLLRSAMISRSRWWSAEVSPAVPNLDGLYFDRVLLAGRHEGESVGQYAYGRCEKDWIAVHVMVPKEAMDELPSTRKPWPTYWGELAHDSADLPPIPPGTRSASHSVPFDIDAVIDALTAFSTRTGHCEVDVGHTEDGVALGTALPLLVTSYVASASGVQTADWVMSAEQRGRLERLHGWQAVLERF